MKSNWNRNRIFAWIAAFVVVLVMLFSVAYISEHVEHECTGHECPVCAMMEMCSESLKTMGGAVVAVLASLFLVHFIQEKKQEQIVSFSSLSLVSQKVRNNC